MQLLGLLAHDRRARPVWGRSAVSRLPCSGPGQGKSNFLSSSFAAVIVATFCSQGRPLMRTPTSAAQRSRGALDVQRRGSTKEREATSSMMAGMYVVTVVAARTWKIG